MTLMVALVFFAGIPLPCAGRGGWTIVGTTVTENDVTALPDVPITLYPESLTVVSDVQGDFFIPWNGGRGWLDFRAPEDMKDSSSRAWCKRFVLRARRPGPADSTWDIGSIHVTPHLPVYNPPSPTLPAGTTPAAKLRVAGPGPDERDRYWMVMRFTADRWGHAGEVKQIAGDKSPSRLQEALFQWIKGVTWSVEPLTPCESEQPFIAIEHYSYAWADSVWVFFKSTPPVSQQHSQTKPPGQ
jgi:hypothetical protein